MPVPAQASRQRTAIVTGGGGGIGTAVALELGRRGVAVVAMDPGVGVQGEPLGEPTAAQTARRITAGGGTARASTVSVTDRAAVRALFAEVVEEFGSLDIVVNTAGILRSASFLQTSEDDWRAVLDVHLNGYLHVLAEALPIMTAAGYGRIVGVTSGAGLARSAADAASYGSAKRAVAAITWQLASLLPQGVTLNALSPLAATRMIRSAAGPAARGQRGVDLSAMPAPEEMATITAYLASQQSGSCRGQVIFSAGSELSVISPPRLLEAVRTERTADFAASLDTLVPVVLGAAEVRQGSTGGSNARFGNIFDQPGTTGPVPGPTGSRSHNCLVITQNTTVTDAVAAAVARCGLTAIDINGSPLTGRPMSTARPTPRPGGFAAAGETLERAAHAAGGLDAVVIAPGSPALDAAGPADAPWAKVLAGYLGTTDRVLAHAGWLQAAVRHAVRTARPLRVVHLTDASSPALHATAQAIAQLARCASLVNPGLIDVFSVALETAERSGYQPAADLAARLLWSGDATALRGAEMFARTGWLGLRSHPGPAATLCYGTPEVPAWIGDWLAEVVR